MTLATISPDDLPNLMLFLQLSVLARAQPKFRELETTCQKIVKGGPAHVSIALAEFNPRE